MLVLLPPSEGKASGGDGPPVGRRPALSTPSLEGPRARLVAALRAAVRSDRQALAAGLKLPPGAVAEALAANSRVSTSGTLAALDRYTGVVYQALDVPSLTPAARRRAEEQLVVVSGLWGLVRGGDLVPDYRVPASGTVPGLGGVTAHWRPALTDAVPALVGDAGVLDLRSTDYRAMWRPSGAVREQVLAVRVLAERPDGRVAPVSFHAKRVKGLVARHLVTARRRCADPLAAVADAADELGLRLLDTSTATQRQVDLVGRYLPGPAVVPSRA